MRRGSSLLAILIISSVYLFLAVILLKIVYNQWASIRELRDGEKAYWLAKAGRAFGCLEIRKNSSWFTDLPHSGEEGRGWLINQAAGSRQALGGGSFKVVRELGGKSLFSVGYYRSARALVSKQL